jgi:ribosomal protein L37AE/L43A
MTAPQPVASDNPQRVYRAACPGCGAPVEFRSAQSLYAVCSFCRSTVVRQGETLARVGRMAELFEDHSPLQLLVTGRWQDQAFALVGRLQYRSPSGAWTEWIALFDNGTQGVLGEDNGAYVFSFPATIGREAPPAPSLRVGATTAIAGEPFEVASNEQVALISAQGELPKLPPLGRPFAMVELRSADGEVLSLDYSGQPPQFTRGRSVRLDDLRLAGLREAQAREEQARQFNCPHCGAPIEVTLASSKSITCRTCRSVIDMSQGVGGELRHAQQDEALEPLVPLGTVGQLQGAQWQVVGFQHRLGHEPGDSDESFGWDEYLLYNRQRGFIFLVDSEEGWSVVKPTTGAPALSPGEQSATYLGTRYELKYSYEAQTTYVAGEFYWPVQRGQKTFNRDFSKGASLLSMERTPREVTWSSGSTIDSDTVAKAFKLEQKREQLKRSDAGPTTQGGGMGCGTVIMLFVIILILLLVMKACMDDRGEGSGFTGGAPRSSGGSFGGYSGGGGHK